MNDPRHLALNDDSQTLGMMAWVLGEIKRAGQCHGDVDFLTGLARRELEHSEAALEAQDKERAQAAREERDPPTTHYRDFVRFADAHGLRDRIEKLEAAASVPAVNLKLDDLIEATGKHVRSLSSRIEKLEAAQEVWPQPRSGVQGWRQRCSGDSPRAGKAREMFREAVDEFTAKLDELGPQPAYMKRKTAQDTAHEMMVEGLDRYSGASVATRLHDLQREVESVTAELHETRIKLAKAEDRIPGHLDDRHTKAL